MQPGTLGDSPAEQKTAQAPGGPKGRARLAKARAACEGVTAGWAVTEGFLVVAAQSEVWPEGRGGGDELVWVPRHVLGTPGSAGAGLRYGCSRNSSRGGSPLKGADLARGAQRGISPKARGSPMRRLPSEPPTPSTEPTNPTPRQAEVGSRWL